METLQQKLRKTETNEKRICSEEKKKKKKQKYAEMLTGRQQSIEMAEKMLIKKTECSLHRFCEYPLWFYLKERKPRF